MKRSDNVGLMMMGGAAFAATFAVGMAYLAWQKPATPRQPQAAAAAQNCTTRPDGARNCPAGHGAVLLLLSSLFHVRRLGEQGRAEAPAVGGVN